MELMNKGWIDCREVHVKETNTLVRLMNAGKFDLSLYSRKKELRNQTSLTRINAYAKYNKHNGVVLEQNSLYEQE